MQVVMTVLTVAAPQQQRQEHADLHAQSSQYADLIAEHTVLQH